MTAGEINQPETLLEADEVAQILRLHVVTVYRKARSGELRGIRIGGRWRFRPSDVSAYQRGEAA